MKLLNVVLTLSYLFIFALLAACSTGEVVQTYQGKALPHEKSALLTISENIRLISVNGQKVKRYLLNNIEVNYGLKEGENRIIFQYESVWGKVKAGKDDFPSERVVSPYSEALIKAKAGEQYYFSFDKPQDIREAKKFVVGFSVNIVDQANVVVAESIGLNRDEAGTKLNAVSSFKVGVDENAIDEKNVSPLSALKVLWMSATPEQKKSFLVWAVQQ